MIRLVVRDFSCIRHADIEVGKLTILIGPQASGKSVISKLICFCSELQVKFYDAIEDREPLAVFNQKVVRDFSKWFPVEAWGSKEFSVEFTAGQFAAKFSGRPDTADPVSPRVTVSYSEWFIHQYTEILKEWQETNDKIKSRPSERESVRFRNLDRFWRLKHLHEKRIGVELGDDYVASQIFVPAGRAFFTSMGKAVTAFEHGGLLDPVTVSFGRLYAQLRDRRFPFFDESVLDSKSARKHMLEFFGGSIKVNRDHEYVESPDGRKVPFSVLSSGQQELMPLWLVTQLYSMNDSGHQLLFVEEPEAHLFPTSQASLTMYLGSLVSSPRNNGRLFLTTHSPYVLSCLNNLLKAGELGQGASDVRQKQVEKVIPKENWLRPGTIRAYALSSNEARSILNSDALIDSEYLDEVSSSVSETFARLLDVEFGN